MCVLVTCIHSSDSLHVRYYEGGISSVYLWDLDEEGSFAGVVLLQKSASHPVASIVDVESSSSSFTFDSNRDFHNLSFRIMGFYSRL